jgi:hypothetical protein
MKCGSLNNKKIKMKKIFLLLFITAALAGCEKEYKSIYTFPPSADKANVKFVHTVPNAFVPGSTTTRTGLQMYINDTKITGSAITFGGGVFPGLEYSQVPAGTVTVKAVIPASGTTPESVAATGSIDIAAGKTYSIFVADTLPTATIVRIEDDLSAKADSGKYFVRFVNMTSKSGAYDLYSTTESVIAVPNIAYKAASGFVQQNVGTGARAFVIRKVGSTTNIGTAVSVTPVPGRKYTFVSFGIDGGTTVRAPGLAFYTSDFQK